MSRSWWANTYVPESINQSIKPLIAGRFSHIGLRQLSAKRFAHQDRLSNWNCLNLLCTCLHICNWYPPTKSVFDYSSVTHVFLPMCACMYVCTYVCTYVCMYVEDHLVHAVLWCPLVGDWAFLSLLAAGVETTQVAGSTDSSPAGLHSQVCVVCAWCVWRVVWCLWCAMVCGVMCVVCHGVCVCVCGVPYVVVWVWVWVDAWDIMSPFQDNYWWYNYDNFESW